MSAAVLQIMSYSLVFAGGLVIGVVLSVWLDARDRRADLQQNGGNVR